MSPDPIYDQLIGGSRSNKGEDNEWDGRTKQKRKSSQNLTSRECYTTLAGNIRERFHINMKTNQRLYSRLDWYAFDRMNHAALRIPGILL